MNLLNVNGITKRYGTRAVLQDVSFSVRPGEMLGLIGPNGAGKTTLFECLAGLLSDDGGTVSNATQTLAPHQRKNTLFYLPDGIAPWAQQTVRWALRFFERLYRSKNQADELLAALKLEHLQHARIGSLSKGERKRTLLALALLTPQPVLLLDEPFDGLDLRQTREVMTLLRAQPEQGRTLMLSIHQLTDAARVCDRLVLLSNGRMVGKVLLLNCAQSHIWTASQRAVWRRSSLLSHSALLFAKEWRELLAARAYWLLLLVIGPLVGQSFISAINLYAEASGSGGAPAALPQELTPLDGILVPTFGAYELAVTLLLPFVAIRLIAAEKESGALKLALQLPASLAAQLVTKLLALSAGWLLAWLPGLLALALWRWYGGHLYAPETLNLLLGHALRMLLGSGLALAAAALMENAASAAIVSLSLTLGTWALDYIATGRGGWGADIAAYTPVAALRFFERGLWRANTTCVMMLFALAGFALAAICLHTGRTVRARLLQTSAVLLCAALGVTFFARLRTSVDLSENRRNSFTRADEQVLRQIHAPLRITINLAAEDPRLMDYERSILFKLQRLLPRLEAVYAANSRTGLFEGASERYGEIWYELDGRRAMNRSTTVPIVLEQLYQLAQLAPPAAVDEPAFPGYPLAVTPRGARLLFYGLWPLAVLATWWLARRR